MVPHKFRERHIFSLLIKEKDKDIITLQLLLQKVDELKGNTHSLSQKMDLNNKIMENPVNVWSVSADDPSNPHVSLTATEIFMNAKDGESTDQNATQIEGKSKTFENVKDSALSTEGVSGDMNLEKTEGGEGLSMREQEGNSNETNVEVEGKVDEIPKGLQSIESSGVRGEGSGWKS
ncbi:hypothetical protein MKX01_032759 [Papaver californicum]|nr:hypothetical protein MKX01_032759 [Papaver californicum]